MTWAQRIMLILMMVVSACYHPWRPETGSDGSSNGFSEGNGNGGGMPPLTLPFESGEYWQLTQGYGDDNVFGSHTDWGFRYGDDSYALDFSQPGCEPYGKPVLAMADGTVMEVTEAGSHDHGYGNSILIDHGRGYVTRYGHLSRILVSEGDSVDAHVRIGEVGNTGHVSGTSCAEHPGTHLHIAVYQDGAAIDPYPLSGRYDMDLKCWYNREGDEDCSSGQPADYAPNDDEEYENGNGESSDDFEITYMDISPGWGNVGDTEFIWNAVVTTADDEEPKVTLWIYNSNDDTNYAFEMETESDSSPWIFSYRKTLHDSIEYSYWVEAEVNGDSVESDEDEIDVSSYFNDPPAFDDFIENPHFADFGEMVDFEVMFESEDWPDMRLMILNPNDAVAYTFEMTVDYDGNDRYVGRYRKELRDRTRYSYWMIAETSHSINTSPVESLKIE